MNIQKGFKRIAIVFAFIAMVPGFYGGFTITENFIEPARTETISWPFESGVLGDHNKGDKVEMYYRPQVKQRPRLHRGIAGLFGSILAFSITFFCIRGLTKATTWVVEGFKKTPE